jgi:diguanylate cyclase (GGDEF)-like protein
VRDRADLPRAIEALGSGSPMAVVMPMIARLAEHSMGGGQVRVALAWLANERIEIATSAELPPLDPRLADVARTVWTLGLGESCVITDLHDSMLAGVADLAEQHGYRGAFIVPVAAPDSSDVIGSMVAWGTSTIDFKAPPQSPVHVALRLAALAISDHRTKLALRWAAAHDPLTGLANRAEFSRRLDQSAHNPLLLLYIDLDDFKPINDQHGHPTGDLVLVEVAQRIAATIGPRDVVGRLGGDEFAVLCPDTDDPDLGRQLGQRIIARLGAPIRAADIDLHVGASVGVAIGAHPLIPSVLAARADSALYEAKRSGKNTVRLADQH